MLYILSQSLFIFTIHFLYKNIYYLLNSYDERLKFFKRSTWILCFKNMSTGMLYSSPSPTLSSRLHVLMTTRTTTTLTTKSFWKPWGKWTCEMHNDVCFRRRNRTCSTGVDKDCIDGSGGVSYRVELCTSSSCPGKLMTF